MSERLASMTIQLRRISLAVFALFFFGASALAGDYYGVRPLRYGNTSSWSFDARNDARDFRNDGFFPGNFAANPWEASIGAAGFLESNPYRSILPYPSQVFFGSADDVACVNRRRSSPRVYAVKDGHRYSCTRSVH